MKKYSFYFVLVLIVIMVFLMPQKSRIYWISNISFKNIDNLDITVPIDFSSEENTIESVDDMIIKNVDLMNLQNNFNGMDADFYRDSKDKNGYFLSQEIRYGKHEAEKLLIVYNRREVHDLIFWKKLIVTDISLAKIQSSISIRNNVDIYNDGFEIASKIKVLSKSKIIYDPYSDKTYFYNSESRFGINLEEIKISHSDINEDSRAYLFEDSYFAEGSGNYRKEKVMTHYPNGYEAQIETDGKRISEISHTFSKLNLSKEADFADANIKFRINKTAVNAPKFLVTFSIECQY